MMLGMDGRPPKPTVRLYAHSSSSSPAHSCVRVCVSVHGLFSPQEDPLLHLLARSLFCPARVFDRKWSSTSCVQTHPLGIFYDISACVYALISFPIGRSVERGNAGMNIFNWLFPSLVCLCSDSFSVVDIVHAWLHQV